MKRLSLFATIALVVLAYGSVASAQTTTPKPPPTYEQVIVNTWKNLHNKILTMAKDTQFPDDKLGWKPHPDSRSMLEEFRHVTIGLEMTTAIAKGEKFDFGAREKMDAPKPKTRADMVAEMEAAIAASYPRRGRRQADSAVDRLDRSPGRALRQAGDRLSRERHRAAD